MGGGQGLSGGERRRVTIGMELVTEPLLLVMDEATSGLDSHGARQLLATCRDVAAAGRVVVASLHQPSPDMLQVLACWPAACLLACVPGCVPA
jgi:ABC-type multidrug transport system ATPase subunit